MATNPPWLYLNDAKTLCLAPLDFIGLFPTLRYSVGLSPQLMKSGTIGSSLPVMGYCTSCRPGLFGVGVAVAWKVEKLSFNVVITGVFEARIEVSLALVFQNQSNLRYIKPIVYLERELPWRLAYSRNCGIRALPLSNLGGQRNLCPAG